MGSSILIMELPSSNTVLGHPRVLAGALPDARHRVLAYDGDVVVGVAAYEPLFGHQAEAAIAVEPDSAGSLGSFLLDSLLELAAGAGITVVRFVFTPGQRGYAQRIIAGRSSGTVRSDRLEIRLSAPPCAGADDLAGQGAARAPFAA